MTELYGDEASRRPAVDEFVCPDTGVRWRLDEKDPEQPRLVAFGP